MGLTLDEIQTVKGHFVEKYGSTETYREYVTEVGISKLGEIGRPALRAGESLDDLCLVVYLRRDGGVLRMPWKFEGARVRYNITGPVTAEGGK